METAAKGVPQPEQGFVALRLPRVEGVNAYTAANEWIETGRALYEESVTGVDPLLQMFANQAQIGGLQIRSVAAQTSH